jgi:hypothetical protein
VLREIDYMGVECTNYDECGCSIDGISGTEQQVIERRNRRVGEGASE